MSMGDGTGSVNLPDYRQEIERIAFPQLSTESILVGNLPITKEASRISLCSRKRGFSVGT